jgi:hypothetical protein
VSEANSLSHGRLSVRWLKMARKRSTYGCIMIWKRRNATVGCALGCCASPHKLPAAALTRLIENDPHSTWVNDARTPCA